MIWMLRSKPSRYALRVDVAVTVAELRRQLVIVRDVTESGKAGPDTLNAVRLHAKPTRDHFLTAAMRLPRMERELAFRWDHAAAMTYWYLHGDRGFAPLEEQAAALPASLPDGVDTAAAEATIAAIHDRTETPILRVPWRGTTDRDRTPDEVDQQGLRERISNDRTRLKFDEILDPDTANSRRAHEISCRGSTRLSTTSLPLELTKSSRPSPGVGEARETNTSTTTRTTPTS